MTVCFLGCPFEYWILNIRINEVQINEFDSVSIIYNILYIICDINDKIYNIICNII